MAINISPTGLARDLQERGRTKPIRIGLIGSGEMGTDIVTRVAHMEGIEIGAIAELNLPNAAKAVDIAYQEKGHSAEGRQCRRAHQSHGIRQGRRHQRR